ncbi:MAG: ribosomal-processing cysteine protease Prp [Clostridia bacterium]|nr:ribosomal-processing cysteine protease Prp [Clostridia bacterium]
MIKFKVKRSADGKIVRFEVEGHAYYAENGADIVCAAVSTACIMAIDGIEELKLADITYKDSDGFLECDISSERKEGADVLLDSLMIMIYEIAKQYKKYLFILEV